MALPMEPPLRALQRSSHARAPRTAEVVAGALRDLILAGDLEVLPRLEDLVERFNVGPNAVREAMRILETEGLITMRRGNVGGADVHLPNADRVAYMASLVLQSKGAALHDVGAALRQVEPLCAAMCAARADRATTVVPELRGLLAEQAAAVGDVPATLGIVDRFHDAIVRACGNETLVLMVGALERLWAGHASAVYNRDDVERPAPATWKASLREHERIVAAIERGDVRVADLARRHLEATHAYMSAVDDRRMVTAAATVGHRV